MLLVIFKGLRSRLALGELLDCFHDELNGYQVVGSGCHMQASPAERVSQEQIWILLEQDTEQLDVAFPDCLVVNVVYCRLGVSANHREQRKLHVSDWEVDVEALI